MSCATRESVRRHYAAYVQHGGDGPTVLSDRAEGLGYESFFLEAGCGLPSPHPDSSPNLSHLFSSSCGSGCPLRLPGGPAEGETVVDLGCGAGHDVVLAARIVGPRGRVIGVDMTEEMIGAAEENAKVFSGAQCGEISFVRAAIDEPGAWETSLRKTEGAADVVLSNGVINLCPDKALAFATAFRALKPGGRFLFSDLCRVERDENVTVSCKVGDGWSS